jgi:hypothetical protein
VAISFPTSLDNFTNPSSGNTLDSPSHSLQHSDINDAVEAMQRKVGVGTAVAGSASAGQVLTISAAGTSTWSTPSQGLTLISTISISALSSQDFVGVFSATYESYRIMIRATHSTTAFANVRLLSGTTPATGGNYEFAGSGINFFAAQSLGGSTTATSWERSGSLKEQFLIFDITAPFLTQVTRGFNLQIDSASYRNFGIRHNLTNSYDGFQYYPSSGTTTGVVSVYGYNK